MSSLVDPSGRAVVSEAEMIKFRIHDTEVEFSTDDPEVIRPHCIAFLAVKTHRGVELKPQAGAMDASAAMTFIATSKAFTAVDAKIAAMGETISTLKEEIRILKESHGQRS